MSAYITLMTPMIDRECLLGALSDAGFSSTMVEVHDHPVELVGYGGTARPQVAEIIVRRQHVGSASNDIGFVSTPLGFSAIISDYDRSRYGEAWLKRLHGRYQDHLARKQERLAAAERRRLDEERKKLVEAQRSAVQERARKLGYRVEETREGDQLRLVLVKRVY